MPKADTHPTPGPSSAREWDAHLTKIEMHIHLLRTGLQMLVDVDGVEGAEDDPFFIRHGLEASVEKLEGLLWQTRKLVEHEHDPDKAADASLIDLCAEFDRLVAADCEGFARDANHDADLKELEKTRRLLDQLCSARATTLAGIAARLRTLLRYDLKLVDPHYQKSNRGWDGELSALVMRDLAFVLKVPLLQPPEAQS